MIKLSMFMIVGQLIMLIAYLFQQRKNKPIFHFTYLII